MLVKNGDVENMQNKIKLIRQTLGVSITDFAELLGVTRQTVYNIENNKKALTKTQYLAIRTIIDYLVKAQPERGNIVRVILESDYLSAPNSRELEL